MTGKKGESVQITKPILEVEVDKQRKLNPGTLKLWDKVWHKCGISVQETSPESGYDQSHSWSSSGQLLADHRRMRMKLSQHGQKESWGSAHTVWGASPKRRSWSRTSTWSTTWTNLLTPTFVYVDVDLDWALFNKHSKTWNDLFFVLHNFGTST